MSESTPSPTSVPSPSGSFFPTITPSRRVVIYTRFSSDMQRVESCDDQERKVREGLARRGIDHAGAVVFRDEAVSGTLDSRVGYDQVKQLLETDQISVLAVDDQSRLSRGSNVKNLIIDLVYHGGRFISVGEAIDTTQEGWKLKVGIMELHHSMSSDEMARRVRRGIESRILSHKGTAGDYCYGYRSKYTDADWSEQLQQGRSPKKDLVIYAPEAEVVKMIFEKWVVEQWSINAITRYLNKIKAPKSHRCKRPYWVHEHVRKILKNPKYIGSWTWGASEGVKDSRGKRRSRKAVVNQAVHVERPDLRIIDQATWDLAQARRQAAQAHWQKGVKPGVPRVPVPQRRAAHNFSGLVTCAHCGRQLTSTRLHVERTRVLLCKTRNNGACDLGRYIRLDQVEKTLLGVVSGLCQAWPDWLTQVRAEMENSLRKAAGTIPGEIIAREKQLQDVERRLRNLAGVLADQGQASSYLLVEMRDLETQAENLRREIQDRQRIKSDVIDLPDDAWIKKQMKALIPILAEPSPRGLALMGAIFRSIRISNARVNGHPFPRLKVYYRFNPVGILTEAMGPEWKARLGPLLTTPPEPPEPPESPESPEGTPEEPELEAWIEPPCRMEMLGPRIAELRGQVLSFKKVAKEVGMSLKATFMAMKMYEQIHRAG